MSVMLKNKNSQTFPYIACVIVCIAIAIMAGLGFWQLDRKGQKEARLQQIEIAKTQSQVDLSQVLDAPKTFEDFVVGSRGTLSQQLFFIDNKIVQGKAGYYVLTPLLTNYGTVMLNLGWVPSTGSRANLPTIEIPQLSEVRGILYLPTDNKIITETNQQYGEFPALLQQVDLKEISKHLNKTVLPFVIRLGEDAPQSGSGFVRDWQVVTMSPEKHLAYAIQWFGLAIAALTVFLLTLLKWMNGPQHRGSKNDKNDNKEQ